MTRIYNFNYMWHILQNIFSSNSFFISILSTNVDGVQYLLNVKKIYWSRNKLKCQNYSTSIMIYDWKSIMAKINHRIYIKKEKYYFAISNNVIKCHIILIKHNILLFKKKKKKTAWDFKSTISQPLNIIDALNKLHRRIFDDV